MRKLILPILFCCCINLTNAQYLETGMMAGVSNYLGELKENYMDVSEYNMAFGVFMRYRFTPSLAVKASFYKGQLSGNDINSSQPEIRARNLSFRSDLLEFGVTGEWHIGGYEILAGKISAPYVFAGLSVFHFNPQSDYHGNWVDLQPLGTEGQGDGRYGEGNYYNLYQVSIPMGVGVQFSLNHQHNIGLEFGLRKTFTDYLDDVGGYYPDVDGLMKSNPMAGILSYRSVDTFDGIRPVENPMGQLRGNPNNKDWYFMAGVTWSINLTDKKGLEWDPEYRKIYE